MKNISAKYVIIPFDFRNKVMSNQPMFWSDIGQEIGIEGVGQVDSSLETVSVFAKDKVEDEYER